MNIEQEIHAINKKLNEVITAIALLKERRANDKEDSNAMSKQIHELVVAVNRLNLTIERSEGKSEGISLTVKVIRLLIGSLIFVSIVGTATLLFDINNRVTILEAGIK